MTINNMRLREEYQADDGPAHCVATYVHDTTTGEYKIVLSGFINIDPLGVQNSDLTAAQAAFTELVTHIRDTHPYTGP